MRGEEIEEVRERGEGRRDRGGEREEEEVRKM